MSLTPFRVSQATAILECGGIVAYPTEAVWGLGCNPADEGAVEHILALKDRPRHKGLILVASEIGQITGIIDGLDDAMLSRLEATWPGPTTWLIPHRQRLPQWITGEHDTVAVRVSAHPVVRALCDAWGGPLVSTSANRSGAREARESYQVRRFFGPGVDYFVPGRVGATKNPSTIRDLLTDDIIRAG